MKLIGFNSTDFQGLDSIYGTYRSCESSAPGPQPQDPIPVQVRIRQYGNSLPEIRRGSASGPQLDRLPVGITLDCYV